MIKKKLVILVSFFILIISCKKENHEQLIINKKKEIIKIDAIGDEDIKPKIITPENVEYIPLETTAFSTIGKIDRIQIFDENYFITDKKNAKGIFIFNKEGHFLNKINPFGKGPHEITYMDDIQYNKITKQVEIYDSARKKILVYSLNGDFIKEFRTKVYLSSFYPIKENERYYYTEFRNYKGMLDTDKNYRLLRMDENANLLSSFFSYKDSQADQKINQLQCNFFPMENSDKVLFLEAFSNNIYELEGNSIFLKYKLDFTNSNIPDDLLDSDEINKIGHGKADLVKKINAALVKNVLFDDNEELVIWYVKNTYRELHYNKKSRKYFEYNKCFVKHDNINLTIDLYVSKKFSLSTIEPMNLLRKDRNIYSSRIQKILANMRSTDNPILVKIKR